ncbi:MAG TPA: S41 family peptidase [Candidatus Levybacteria bacterium]|nr:S41 family peptidase [Candidatus Levybacteria bacterium]
MQNNVKRFQILLLMVVCVLAGYAYGTRTVTLGWENYKPVLGIETKAPPPGQSIDFSLLYDVIDRVNRDYYDKSKVDSQKLLYGAVSGMLESLDDPYTSFFPPKENDAFKTQMAGEFSGIGAELGMTSDKRITVISPLDDSPAQKAGIRSGDIIVKVNDDETFGWSIQQAVEKIRGEKGTQVTLSVLHDKAKSPVDIKVTRDTIKIDSVTAWVKKVQCSGDECNPAPANCNNCSVVAYMRVSQFGDRTNDEWIKKVNDVYSQIQKENNVKGVVLDVRNNPGGYLTDAVFIASEFVDSGVIVRQEDGAGQEAALSVSRKGLLLDVPLVVLINKGSASASEIVSGALRDHDRAQLIGETSFGKGTIQQALDVDAGSSIHLTIAKWLTPDGTWVHEKGLEPDIEVVYDQKKSDGKEFDNQLQRAIQELLK